MQIPKRNVHLDRFRNQVGADTKAILASEPEILGNANGICAEVVRKQLQMSVRLSRFILF